MAKQRNHNGILYTRVTPWWKWDKLYRVDRTYWIDVGLRPSNRIDVSDCISIMPNGVMYISEGFLFGPSGPTIDTANFMRGSLVHDAFYAALRSGKLLGRFERGGVDVTHDELRKTADDWIYWICLQDGMSEFRAQYVYDSLRAFGASSAEIDGPRKELR